MVLQAHVLHSRERQMMPAASDGVSYYAHCIALLVLVCLWRFPANAFAKQVTIDPHVQKIVTPTKSLLSKSDGHVEEDETVTSQDVEDDEKNRRDEELAELFPNATGEERRRFLDAKGGNFEASKIQLAGYLEWREKHDAIEKTLQVIANKDRIDHDDWDRAVAMALVSCEEDVPSDTRLPRLARMYTTTDTVDEASPVCDLDGCRILHVMPGQMDPKLARPSTYAVALALYIDRKLDRASLECLTVVLDVRGGKGWPNIQPLRQLPFVQTVIILLLKMFPERLYNCLLLPVPKAAFWMWNMVKVWIDPVTACKIQLLTGPACVDSSAPMEAMKKFLGPQVSSRLEEERHKSFIISKENDVRDDTEDGE